MYTFLHFCRKWTSVKTTDYPAKMCSFYRKDAITSSFNELKMALHTRAWKLRCLKVPIALLSSECRNQLCFTFKQRIVFHCLLYDWEITFVIVIVCLRRPIYSKINLIFTAFAFIFSQSCNKWKSCLWMQVQICPTHDI